MSGYRTSQDRLRILVMGYIVRGPMGGMTWHYLQYLLGLQALGHEVAYLEDSGDSEYCCYDPERGLTDANPAYGLNYTNMVFRRSGYGDRWAYYDYHSTSWRGPMAGEILQWVKSCDVMMNLSCANPVRDWLQQVPTRILVDTDPVFTQIRNIIDANRSGLTQQHNAFFSFAENIFKRHSSIPDDGIPWKPTRQPVFLDKWPVFPGRRDSKFTTVMQWDSYAPLRYDGRSFGVKSHAFADYIHLPGQTAEILEIALGSSSAPREELRNYGWRLVNPQVVAFEPWQYQGYIQDSKAEFSVSKEAYVTACTGWFSERSCSYLASGRPVLVQDTGFTDWLPEGQGVVAFSNPATALEGIKKVDLDYSFHCRKAREIAEEYFDSTKVLANLLDRAVTVPS